MTAPLTMLRTRTARRRRRVRALAAAAGVLAAGLRGPTIRAAA